ncbi:transporter, major facilitator family protein [Ancylostoma duodenale]|uniref:Transporter, major facilitator family protein n=2 Tax=Ancylostoma duodenale TaxID=51022 RepID=A0A0C2FFP6_9BILA|nr:transporter, major facilitator family protein [Ancylostoma duodenale]
MPSISIHVLSIALCLSSGFQQGYIASVLNQPYLQIENYINESWTERMDKPLKADALNVLWSLLNVCFPIATIFGQFLAAFLCKEIGRKGTALLASSLYIPGVLLCAAAKYMHPYFELLYIGRILWSLANGINSVNATVWIVECAPPEIRGRMAAMQEFFMAAGALVTQGLGVPFSNDDLWPYVFIPNVVFVLFSMALFAFVYESPQYIMEKEGNRDKARKALAAYHGVSIDDASVESELRICEDSATKKTPKANGAKSAIKIEHDSITVIFMPWKAQDATSQVIREAAWLGVMVKIAYVFTGARCLRAFSTYVLYGLGGWSFDSALYGSFVTSLLRLPFTLIPVFLVDRLGRRPLMISSTAISALSLIAMIVAIDLGPNFKVITLIGLSVLLLITACGIGSVSRFYAAELVPRSLLISSVSILTMFEALTKIAVEFAWYPVANVIGAQSLLMFLLPTAVFLLIMWAFCPETSKRTVNEVLNEVAMRKNLKVSFPM